MSVRQRGFTLIEVLIALAVVSISLVAFVSTGAQNADYATYIRQRTVAQWVARNRLVEYQIAPTWPDIGKTEGDVQMGGSRWHWQTTIKSSPDPQVRRADVRVFAVDPDNHKPDRNSIVLMSGFVTQHRQTEKNDSDTRNTSQGTGPGANRDASDNAGGNPS